METSEVIQLLKDFIEKNCTEEIYGVVFTGKKHIVLDFCKLSEFNTELAEYVLDNPTDAIASMVMAAKQVEQQVDSIDFTVRIKNAEKYCTKQINKLRHLDIGKLVCVKGTVKQKSDVRPQITSAKFECPSCGNTINVLQLDEKVWKEPRSCGCGRKGHFRLLDKEEIDVYSMMLEEPTDIITGGTKLSQIKVLCKTGLADPDMERLLYQGVTTEITGILTEFQVKQMGKLTPKVDWYLDANYIKIFDETFLNIKWDHKDIESFIALSSRPDWLRALRNSIFYDVHGYDEECEGVILQMFSGVGKDRHGLKIRGNLHVLLIGDPGSSKSSILKIAQKFAPKARYVAGKGVSGVGLTAAVVRDELLGGFTLEAGALVLANNGMLMLDELDKVSTEDKEALHEPLSDETISISKGNIQATLIAQTSVLAAANPKLGSYSDYDTVYAQIDLTPTLINRFDLVYPLKDSKLSPDDHENIAKKILSRGQGSDDIQVEFTREFIKKYVAYARTITPEMPPEIQGYLANKYRKLKEIKTRQDEEGKMSLPITGRNVEAFRRIIEAVARSRLHKVITQDDTEIGYQKMMYSIKQVGIDPSSGEIFEESIQKPMKEKDIITRICVIIRDRTSNKKGLLSIDELYAILASEGITDTMKVDKYLMMIKERGDIYEPISGKLQWTI